MHWGDWVAAKTAEFGPLVIGIDPVESQAPEALATGDARFLERYTDLMLEAAEGHAGFVKFQSAFFEAFGSAGVAGLAGSIRIAKARGFGVIMDAKRGDIGSTAEAYARTYLEPGATDLESDCLTVNPFLGPDTLEPFVSRARNFGKGVFVLVKTSNPGSGWLQDQRIDGATVAARTAKLVAALAEETQGASGVGAVGAVVGSTYPEEGLALRALMPRGIILAPGLGAQGGDAAALGALKTATGPVLAPVSRGLGLTKDRGLSLRAYRDLIGERIAVFKAALAA
jgi:orotidine-5'-phosphate decarboxylase